MSNLTAIIFAIAWLTALLAVTDDVGVDNTVLILMSTVAVGFGLAQT